MMKILNATSKYVIFFGLFVIFSLIFQCIIPFFSKYSELTGYTGFFTIFLNQNFVLPMSIISDFWAAISAGYVGVDRGMYMIDGFKNGGDHSEAFSEDQLSHLTQVIIESFLVYTLAVVLNLFFDSDLALSPLAVSFGTSILLYVVGNKGVKATQALSPEEDSDQDGIRDIDQLNDVQRDTLTKVIAMMRSGKPFVVKINLKGSIEGKS